MIARFRLPMSASEYPDTASRPAPVLGLFSDGFAARRGPYPAVLPFTHACDPTHRFAFSVADDWYGRWNVLPWRPPAAAIPEAAIVSLSRPQDRVLHS
ncbi:hypothetical protein [Methylorubrum suomiense]|nr:MULTISPECIES: hypothetical protein [Methylobacteriaceae]